ncbi:MAG TPA: SPOR domain-containing protein [Desulfatiglandales bacterium]|nr:SPOR domain-containing protein [Desulfatiglandales bacterium]
MPQALKHFATRIWLSAVVGGLISLRVLPHIQFRIGLEWVLLPAGVILAVLFWAFGWAFNRWAIGTVKRLVREAGGCERDGMYPEAENLFRSAAAVFDSFLISPLARRGKSSALAARMARFYLARTDTHPESERFLRAYLYDHPEDEEIAESWLAQIGRRGGLKERHEELAHRIGNALPANKPIQFALARFYLLFERTDFFALQTYRRVLHQNASVPAKFVEDLARLFLTERRVDERALQVYLQAMGGNLDRSELLRGIAACVRWTPAAERTGPLLQRATACLDGFDELQLERMSADFEPPAPPPAAPKIRRKIGLGTYLANSVRGLALRISHGMSAAAGRVIQGATALAGVLQGSRRARRALGAAMLAGLTAAVAYLSINTVSYLIKAEPTAQEAALPQKVTMTDPFTIQVAAYLKSDYAFRFVEQLKAQGLGAYWTQAVGGDKRWYQVRISHFPDKQSAREYGESLKARGIVEDFYVANYQRP